MPNSVHLALHEDETSQLCTWHLSRAHYLESWGDARTFDGTVSIVQPLIEPLFDGRSPIEVLSLIVDEKPRSGYDIVRETVKSLVGKSFTEYRWKKLLAEGVIEGTEWKPARIEKLADGDSDQGSFGRTTASLAKGEYELVFYTDKVYDGRFANNGWLQELPDPMTRLTWDNAAVMSEKTADDIGVKQDELVELTVGRGPGPGPGLLPARRGRRRDRPGPGLWPHRCRARRQRRRLQRLRPANDRQSRLAEREGPAYGQEVPPGHGAGPSHRRSLRQGGRAGADPRIGPRGPAGRGL